MQIGIDLGGTKTEGIALEGDRLVVPPRRVVTPRNYEGTLDVVARLVAEIEAEAGGRGSVGVGIPGVVARANGLVKNANSVWLNGQPLADDLRRVLPRPLRFANDANCFALSEAVDGAAAGAGAVFGVIVGTGTGGGVVLHNRIWTGPNAIAGEFGHNPLPWPNLDEGEGPECYCGKNGCIETYLSGPGLSRDHERTSGQLLDPIEIAARAAAGDVVAEATLRRYEDRMARALASVVNILDPDVVVLGGGLSNLSRLYDTVPRRWTRYVFSDRVDTRLVSPRHGDSSGVRGAAWLWPREG